MKYFIKFSYDGSCFNGFQRQEGLKTVQRVLEDALYDLTGSEVSICASGRTDKGVHARGQCAHFETNREYKLYNLKKFLNNKCDGEIYIKDVSIVNDDFHARYDVYGKIYSYYINMGEYNPIDRNYVYQFCDKLDVDLMKEASLCLLGEHDFRSFCTDEKSKDNCIRNVYDISFDVKDDILKITFFGNGFLRKMIRNIVAILIQIGEGKKDVSFMEEVLNNKSREGNLKCALGCGLYLDEVIYKGDIDE